MIAYLNGILAEIEEENIVIEVNGIGYNVRIPAGMAGDGFPRSEKWLNSIPIQASGRMQSGCMDF